MSAQYSHYDALENMKKAVADGHHRAVIGGMWNEPGALQKRFLLSQGLKPHHRFIDMGCGSLRAGVPLTEYLDPDRYYGVDISADLLEAGYEREIVPAGLDAKLPRDHLAANADFDATGFGVSFDYGIAQSVFTHMPIARLTDCLTALAPVFAEGGRFYVTFFERPAETPADAPLPHEPGGVVTYPDRDPYDTTIAALSAATPQGWRLDVLNHWDHPRDQRMALFVRETGQGLIMPTYLYRGLNSDGAEVDGRLTAADEVEALRQLEVQRIAPFKLNEAGLEPRKYERKKARPQDRFRFMRQLSVLLKAGTPLLDAFDSLSADEPCKDLAEQALSVRRDLRSGAQLSLAMRDGFPDLPAYAPRLIELGEATGQLPKALADISSQMEHDLKAASEIRNALAYPAFLAVAGVFAIVFIFLFVVPRFANLLGDDRSSLPALSRWVIETGVFMSENMVQTGLFVAGAAAVVFALSRNKGVRTSVSELMHRMPVVGSFLTASEVARWARACGTALSGGAPLVDALVLAESAVTSARRKQGLAEARRAIRSGEPIDAALKTHAGFDSMTVNLVRTGRASASLDEMLLFVADLYEEESRNRAKRLTSLAEPLAILFIAMVVGTIVISLVLAMTSIYDIAI